MDFYSNTPIFIQIADALCERILSGELKADSRIPSVREYGAEIGVNPNTVMRSYERLTGEDIIYNKRGIGYFICPHARERILEKQRKAFLESEIPEILKRMRLLGIPIERLIEANDRLETGNEPNESCNVMKID